MPIEEFLWHQHDICDGWLKKECCTATFGTWKGNRKKLSVNWIKGDEFLNLIRLWMICIGILIVLDEHERESVKGVQSR